MIPGTVGGSQAFPHPHFTVSVEDQSVLFLFSSGNLNPKFKNNFFVNSLEYVYFMERLEIFFIIL
jgi:hypothetical protein